MFKGLVPQELIQSAIAPAEVKPPMDLATTADDKIYTISNSILKTGAEIAPGILGIAVMIWGFRKVYQHTLGDIL